MTEHVRDDGGPRRAALVLAAGASTRFGGIPKATLPVDGETAVARIVRLARSEGLTPVVVVGAHGDAVRQALAGESALVVQHTEWSLGRTSSLQAGLRAVPEAELAAVWPVDHPFAESSSLRTVLDAADRDPLAVWVIPTFANRGGHPVALKRATFGAIGKLAPDAPLRGLHAAFGPQVRRVPVEDPGVVVNVDTPQEYERALAVRRETRWTAG